MGTRIEHKRVIILKRVAPCELLVFAIYLAGRGRMMLKAVDAKT